MYRVLCVQFSREQRQKRRREGTRYILMIKRTYLTSITDITYHIASYNILILHNIISYHIVLPIAPHFSIRDPIVESIINCIFCVICHIYISGRDYFRECVIDCWCKTAISITDHTSRECARHYQLL